MTPISGQRGWGVVPPSSSAGLSITRGWGFQHPAAKKAAGYDLPIQHLKSSHLMEVMAEL